MAHRLRYVCEVDLLPRLGHMPHNATLPQSRHSAKARAETRPSFNRPAPRGFNGRVMDSFVLTMKGWFDLWVVKSFRARGSGTNTPPKCGYCHSSSPSGGRKELNNRKRRRDEQDSENEDSDVERGGNGEQPDRKRTKTDASTARNLACPFFKHNPTIHQRYQSCSRQGFPTVHRVKQHLYKRHRLPEYSCLRCFESFADNASLSDHSRSESLCDIREPIVVEGVSKQQEAELKKRSKNAHTESQKWVEVFLLLFPATSPRDVPSPYVGVEVEPEAAPILKPCNSLRCLLRDNYQDLEQFLFCQSRRHLIKQLQEAGGQLKDMLRHPEKAKVVEIIPKVLIGLLHDFHERNRESEEDSLDSRTPDSLTQGIHQSELDDLARQLPTDLSPTELDPFSTLALPPVPVDIISSLDWLAASPSVDFDSFCNPPLAFESGHYTSIDPISGSTMEPAPRFGDTTLMHGLGDFDGSCQFTASSTLVTAEGLRTANSASTLSLGSDFSNSSHGRHRAGCVDTDIESLLSDVSVD